MGEATDYLKDFIDNIPPAKLQGLRHNIGTVCLQRRELSSRHAIGKFNIEVMEPFKCSLANHISS